MDISRTNKVVYMWCNKKKIHRPVYIDQTAKSVNTLSSSTINFSIITTRTTQYTYRCIYELHIHIYNYKNIYNTCIYVYIVIEIFHLIFFFFTPLHILLI